MDTEVLTGWSFTDACKWASVHIIDNPGHVEGVKVDRAFTAFGETCGWTCRVCRDDD